MPKSIDHVKQKTGAPVDSDSAADDVLEAIHAVMHQFRLRQYRVVRDGPHDLTHLEGKVLGYFARHPGATQRDLAGHSGRDRGQLARLIGGLRERGLLDARADEADRRNLLLQPTAEGRALQQTLQRRARRVAEQALAGLSREERQQLVELLARVRTNLENAP